MNEPRELLEARAQLAQAEASYASPEGLGQLEDALELLDEIIATQSSPHRTVARNVASTYAAKICGGIASLLAADRAVPEPQLEHLFKVVLAFDQGEFDVPQQTRALKIEIARRLIDRYCEGHSPEYKRKALEQLMEISKARR